MMPPKHRPSGTIGVAAHETGRYTEFSLALGRLDLPPGWEIMAALNYDLAHARNFLAHNFKGDFLLLLDDDHSFRPDLVTRLVEHNQPVVGALYCGRKAPFPAYAKLNGRWLDVSAPPRLVEVDEVGGGALLIRRDVFAKLEEPFFQHGPGETPLEHVSDDAFFCRRLRDAGIPVLVDTGTTVTHNLSAQVTPVYRDGKWRRTLSVGGVDIDF